MTYYGSRKFYVCCFRPTFVSFSRTTDTVGNQLITGNPTHQHEALGINKFVRGLCQSLVNRSCLNFWFYPLLIAYLQVKIDR